MNINATYINLFAINFTTYQNVKSLLISSLFTQLYYYILLITHHLNNGKKNVILWIYEWLNLKCVEKALDYWLYLTLLGVCNKRLILTFGKYQNICNH
jgi:hypothetical protein